MALRTKRFSWKIDPDRRRELPEGRLDLTIGQTARGRYLVHAAYVTIVGRGPTASSRTMDHGRVTVDFDSTGQVSGLEFLAKKAPQEIPEFLALARKAGEKEFWLLIIAAATAIIHWDCAEENLFGLTEQREEESWADDSTPAAKEFLAMA